MIMEEQKQFWTMRIRPHEKLWHIDLGEIWRYRDLIELFVRRNIVVQYKQTILGPLWYLILANPMTSIIEAFKYATLGHGYFSWFALGYSFLFMSVLLLFSVVIFNKVQRNFMDTV